MSWIVAIIVGAIIGWLASSVMGEREGLVGKIVIGIVGSLLAKWLFADVLHIGGAASAGTFTIAGLIWGVIGAILLIWVLRALKLVR
ncbi:MULTISPECIES: GlsB/YeaQ/YmgE family stress response membrane protein [unclassified Meiothermus]|uniref:GlsB/YeaQ/YmgE family stress response membrane protein n=1 Tax=unclassified Meiothermus TaxID=370471 RepID=UPI000D7BE9C7|nr:MULTISPECIES: GlsB/YeaQ/YmgE family stress response membrane protein [unclassified Meiothermus]PZA06635.1 GlsB/YeaQ/YmgE family stress response membrane protein [Meiothermus sp. Pnk-1]RYM30258.1 GlsB/YeaQ/YmgE family stress response membrane protein [Meiothermus sp. PNK-Is4]